VVLGEGGGGCGGVVFDFGVGGAGGIMPGLVKVGIGEVFGTVPDEFVAFVELVKVVFVNFIAEVVF